ncbi:hypothetical protein G5I_02861 [Acromyrmex echinatior]|uniref:Uncharacterized protein n=1 Tax=Acromyrmex echinatior TaxID=103372 RepID=F4WBF1_ACREC|nr:hypothetical protein G5I_02861 [Acromyrmex echinatior]
MILFARLIFVSQRYTVSKVVFALRLVTTESRALFDHYMRKGAGFETIRKAAAPHRERMVTGGGVAISKNNGEPGSLFWEVGGGPHSGGPAIPLEGWGRERGQVYCTIPAFVSALQDRLLMFPSLGNPVISPT